MSDQETLDELRQQLADEVGVPLDQITTFTCGPHTTCQHQMDGPMVDFDNVSSVSCSKCGTLAIDVDMWRLP